MRKVVMTLGFPTLVSFLSLLFLLGMATAVSPPKPIFTTLDGTTVPHANRAIAAPVLTAISTSAAITLAAVFAPWYGYDPSTGDCKGGLGSYHWNNDQNMAGVVDAPAQGYYCSSRPEIIEWQLDGLERSGVRTLFVSWWGWGDGDLDGHTEGQPDAYMNRGITTLLDQIAPVTSTHHISVSLIVEPFFWTQQTYTEPIKLQASQQQMVLEQLWADYYGQDKYHNVWFQWEGKPLLLAFDPMSFTLPTSATYPISYTIRDWTGRAKSVDTVAEGWQWFFGPPQGPIDGLSSDGVAFVYPRFDEVPAKLMGAKYITWNPRSIDPLLRQCAYERQWQQLAEHRSEINMVVVYGWNLYGEQAYIEPAAATLPRPSIGYGYVDRTREYHRALVQGSALVPASYCAYMPYLMGAAP